MDLFLWAGKLVIDGVVGRRISQDPGHAIGRHCDVPERLRGRPSSQILDSRRLQRHENHASILENSLPSFSKGRGGTSESCLRLWKKRRPSSSRRLLLLLLLFPPRRGNLMLRRKKSERRCFTRRGAAWAPCIVGCHLVTNRLSRTEYGTDCVSGRALF